MLCRPGAQYTLPTQALGTPQSTRMGSSGHPCSHHPRKDHSGGTQPGRGCSVGTGGRWPKYKEVRRSGPWPAPREPYRERGVLARKTGHRRGKSSRGRAARRPAPLLWRTSGGAPAPQQRASFPPPAPAQPPRTHSWRGTPVPAPRGRSSRPHLANRTVPCSSGLRLTSRQLCRISSGSGRSMLARGRGALGWDPRGAGTVTARAAPSPRRRGQSAPPTAPAPRPGGVLQPLLPRPGGGAPAGPAPLALPGTPLRPLRPAPHGSESAPPPAARAGAL